MVSGFFMRKKVAVAAIKQSTNKHLFPYRLTLLLVFDTIPIGIIVVDLVLRGGNHASELAIMVH